MKTSIIFTITLFTWQFCQAFGGTEQAVQSDVPAVAAVCRGVAYTTELLWQNPSALANLHCASVLEVAIDFDTGLPLQIIDDGTQKVAKRIKFKLQHHDLSDSGVVVDDSFIDWVTGSRGLRNLPRPARAVLDFEPFSAGNLILFSVDPAGEERGRYKQVSLLLQNFFPVLESAREWRKANANFFSPTKSLARDAEKIFREGLKSVNVLVRLSTLVRLAELRLATFEDIAMLAEQSTAVSDTGALTLLLINRFPIWSSDIAALAAKLKLDNPVVGGIALGAAINFLGQDEALLKSALTFQTFRNESPDMPPELIDSVSYPILKAIGDKVKPLHQQLTIDRNSVLARLLVITRALHRQRSEEK